MNNLVVEGVQSHLWGKLDTKNLNINAGFFSPARPNSIEWKLKRDRR